MAVIVRDSWHGHLADTSADKLTTCRDIGDGDKTCLQKWGLADMTWHRHFQLSLFLKLTCLDFLGMRESIDSILCFPSAPFGLIALGGLVSTSVLFLISIFSRINRRALVLTGVVFSVKSYWVCHLDGHMRSKCIARLASSKGNSCFVAWFPLGL
jgi:hypothetical protein